MCGNSKGSLCAAASLSAANTAAVADVFFIVRTGGAHLSGCVEGGTRAWLWCRH
mgnify:CR=1 FL=1